MMPFIITFVSCEKWLTVESEKSVTYINYFKSESDVEQFFNSIMINARLMYSPQQPLPHYYQGLQADEYSRNIIGYVEFDLQTMSNITLGSSWSTHYALINLANTLLDNAYRFQGISDERKEFWLAQANYFKAAAYFELAKRWGEVPIVGDSESIKPVSKSAPIDVLLEAIRCAEQALVLPEFSKLKDSYGKSITSKQYACLGTAHNLLANIYAWIGGVVDNKPEYWEKVIYHSSQIIEGRAGDYSLEPSIKELIKNTFGSKRISQETIFSIENNEMDEDRFNRETYDIAFQGIVLINYPYVTADPTYNETASNVTRIKEWSVKQIYKESNDQRLNEFWYNLGRNKYTVDGKEKTCRYAYINKWREPVISNNPSLTDRPIIDFENDIIIYRLADLVLLRAEARARRNDSKAVNDLNMIRNRAGIDNYDGDDDYEKLREEIYLERERELFGEGQRYIDIIRNGYHKKYLKGGYTMLTDEEIELGALYLPVSSKSFTNNPLMTQNKYWLWKK